MICPLQVITYEWELSLPTGFQLTLTLRDWLLGRLTWHVGQKQGWNAICHPNLLNFDVYCYDMDDDDNHDTNDWYHSRSLFSLICCSQLYYIALCRVLKYHRYVFICCCPYIAIYVIACILRAPGQNGSVWSLSTDPSILSRNMWYPQLVDFIWKPKLLDKEQINRVPISQYQYTLMVKC